MDWRSDGLTALVSIAAGKAADLMSLPVAALVVFLFAGREPGVGMSLALWPLTILNMVLPPLLGGLIYREIRGYRARRS